MFPETYGRTLEELAFLFEDDARAEEAQRKVEKQLQHELNDYVGYNKGVQTHITATHRRAVGFGDDRFSRWP